MARNTRLLAALGVVLGAIVLSGSAVGGALPEDGLLVEHWDGLAWTTTPATPPYGGSILNAVTAVSPTELWAVGSTVKPLGGVSSRPLVEHYDGAAWTPLVLRTPTPKATSDLVAVSASSAKDVWAVGSTYRDMNSTVQSLIEHYDGKTWRRVRDSHTSAPELAGVAAVSRRDAWAVGRFLAHGRYHALIEHWNGSAWHEVSIPHPGGTWGHETLDAVSSLTARNIWAVGDYERRHRYHTLVLHWNGSHWKRVVSPTRGSKHESLLNGVVALGRKNAWAVGSYPGPEATRPLTEHWDGRGWHIVATPPSSGFNVLEAVSAVSSTDVWAVGLDGPGKPLAEHWDGHAWTVSTTALPSGVLSSFAGVAAVTATDVWAVGSTNAP